MKIFQVIFVLAFCSVKLVGQDTLGSWNLREELSQKEFEVWSHRGTDSFAFFVLRKAQFERKHNLVNRAFADLQRIRDDSSFSRQYFYETALCDFLQGDYENAHYNISKSIELRVEPTRVEMELRCLAEIETARFPDACQSLLSLCPRDSGEILAVSILVRDKDPSRAMHLSACIPGLGQMYAGYPAKGLTSFGFVVASVGIATASVLGQLYVLAVVAGIYPASRFYNGGKHLSYSLAEKHNLHERTVVKDKLRGILLRNTVAGKQ